MEGHLLTPWQQFGLIGLMIGAITILLFIVIKWTLTTTKEILTQAAKEREDWHNKIGSVNTSMQKVCDCIDSHDKRAEERGKYVRDEHKEMIDVLKRINGYKDK